MFVETTYLIRLKGVEKAKDIVFLDGEVEEKLGGYLCCTEPLKTNGKTWRKRLERREGS